MGKLLTWKHKTKFKGKFFRGNYELRKNGERWFHLIEVGTGKTRARYRSYAYARKDGWVQCK
jgi:hypothetical protein